MKYLIYIIFIYTIWWLQNSFSDSCSQNSYPLVYGGYTTSFFFGNTNKYLVPFWNIKDVQFEFSGQLEYGDLIIGSNINEITFPEVSTDVIASLNFMVTRINQNSGEVLWAKAYLYPDIQLHLFCLQMTVINQVTNKFKMASNNKEDLFFIYYFLYSAKIISFSECFFRVFLSWHKDLLSLFLIIRSSLF